MVLIKESEMYSVTTQYVSYVQLCGEMLILILCFIQTIR